MPPVNADIADTKVNQPWDNAPDQKGPAGTRRRGDEDG